MPKYPSKVKVVNIKLKIIILWILKGHFSIWKGHCCIVCQKVEEPWPLWPPGSYVPAQMTSKTVTSRVAPLSPLVCDIIFSLFAILQYYLSW